MSDFDVITWAWGIVVLNAIFTVVQIVTIAERIRLIRRLRAQLAAMAPEGR